MDSTVIGKMHHDIWSNLVILKSGKWFRANEIISSYKRYGQYWFEFDSKDVYSNFPDAEYDFGLHRDDYLYISLCRNIAVNVGEISCIIETDS